MHKLPADQQQREQAANPRHSCIVQAPAGSGKTELLILRYLKLLSVVDAPERILAITFTRKATQEMRRRILLRLQQAESGGDARAPHQQKSLAIARKVLQRDRELEWNISLNPQRLRIYTIDAYCAQLAARRPLINEGLGNLPLSANATELYETATNLLLQEAVSGDTEQPLTQVITRVLEHLDGNPQRLQMLLAEMLGQRDQWLGRWRNPQVAESAGDWALLQLQRQTWDGLQQALNGVSAEELITAVAMFGDHTDSQENPQTRLAAYLHAHKPLLGDDPETALFCLHQAAQALATGNGSSLRKLIGPRGGFPLDTPARAGAKERLLQMLERIRQKPAAEAALLQLARAVPMPLASEQAALSADLHLLLTHAAAYLRLVFIEQSGVDFQQVTAAAIEALGEDQQPTDLMLSEDQRIEHLLMDEFQDTSRMQFRLLQRVLSGWTGDDGRTLFLVGDPMQSIYRFREAEVGLFLRVWEQQRFAGLALQRIRLCVNFRSGTQIIDWVNRRFQQVFPASSDVISGAVAYAAAQAGQSGGGAVQLHPLGPEADETSMAAATLAVIEQSRKQHPQGTVAVLARSRRHLIPIAQQLLRAQIPFQGVDIDPLLLRPVIQDLLSILRALWHPLDRVAWLALLRGPWCGLTVAEMHQLLGDDAEQGVAEALQAGIAASDTDATVKQRVTHLLQVMGKLQAQRGELSLARLVEIAWLLLGAAHTLLSRDELEHAERFFQALEQVEAEQADDPVGLLTRRLQQLYADSGEPAAVQLMTIHKAKGLEFDTVLLPDLERTTRPLQKKIIHWRELDDEQGYSAMVVAPISEAGSESGGLYEFLGEQEKRLQANETQRLLYVASTRARAALHLFARWTLTPKGQVRTPAKGSLAALIWPAFLQRIDPEAAPPAAASPAVEDVTYPTLRLRQLPSRLFQLAAAELERQDPQARPALHVPDPDKIALGSAAHLWLEVIHNYWDLDWSSIRWRQLQPALEASLAHSGASPDQLQQGAESLDSLLQETLASDSVRDMLSPEDKTHSYAELEIYDLQGCHIRRQVLDRLYFAGNQVHILDYKTGSGGEQIKPEWVAQLSRYAALMSKLSLEVEPSCWIYALEQQRLLPIPVEVTGPESAASQ